MGAGRARRPRPLGLARTRDRIPGTAEPAAAPKSKYLSPITTSPHRLRLVREIQLAVENLYVLYLLEKPAPNS